MCTNMYFLKYGDAHLVGPTRACLHDATTTMCSQPIDVNAVLVGFLLWFYLIFFFPSSFFFFFFCACEDANVTHKVSIVKENRKKSYIVGFVCSIALISVAKPASTWKTDNTASWIFGVKFRGDMQMEAYSYCG